MPLKRDQDFDSRRLVVLIAILVSFALNGYSQRRQPIMYLLPDTVKSNIQKYLKDKDYKSTYVVLRRDGDTASILVSTYSRELTELAYLIRNSNRYISIDSKTIPVILQEDVVFSDKLHTIKNKGTLDEYMSNKEVHASGYLIVYKGFYWGTSILKAEYYTN